MMQKKVQRKALSLFKFIQIDLNSNDLIGPKTSTWGHFFCLNESKKIRGKHVNDAVNQKGWSSL